MLCSIQVEKSYCVCSSSTGSLGISILLQVKSQTELVSVCVSVMGYCCESDGLAVKSWTLRSDRAAGGWRGQGEETGRRGGAEARSPAEGGPV